MFLTRSEVPARVLAAVCVGSLAAVGFALTAQHAFGVKPCPWCVFQRGIFLLLALAAGLGWLARRQPLLRRAGLLAVLLLALGGIAAAYYQYDVASKLASCDLTFADRVLSALKLESTLPYVFMVTASCAEASKHLLLGLGYEVWGAMLYTAAGIGALVSLGKR